MTDVKASPRSVKGRRKIARQIDIPEDVFLASSVGDIEWLRHSVAGWNRKSEVPYDKNGFSPLHTAAAHARLDCIKHFVEKLGYNVNLVSQYHGWLPVQLVVNHLNDDRTAACLKYLIGKGANVNGVNNEGTTALHQAATEGDNESIKILLDHGANPFLEDTRSCTPLQLAKIWGHREAARVLENAIWRLKKSEEAKLRAAALETDKEIAIDDIGEAVDKFSKKPADSLVALGSWLRDHGLDEHSTKSKKRFKPSGSHPSRKLNNRIPDPPESPFHKPRTEKMATGHSMLPEKAIKRHGVGDSMNDMDLADNEEVAATDYYMDDLPAAKNISALTIEQLRVYHGKPWIKSTKVPENDYIPNLPDIYPRDEYTMTPTKFSSPFLCVGDVRETVDMQRIAEPMRQIRYEGKGPPLDRRSHSPRRPVVYKASATVFDIAPLRRPDPNAMFCRDEVALHLVSDPNSLLFKMSLQPKVLTTEYATENDNRPKDITV